MQPSANCLPNTTSKILPLIIGHRGSSALAPENTVAAFRRALDDGAAGIELDVRLSADSVPVVIHDATLRRTGQTPGVVAKMTAAELSRTDVGGWFNQKYPRLAQPEYKPQFVPTLESVFRLFRKRAGVIYVEMKVDHAKDVHLAEAVARLIKTERFRNRVVVIGFDLDALVRIKTIDSSIATGALFEPRRNPVKTIRQHPMIAAALACGADQILLHRLFATERLVKLALESNLRPVIWTVDDARWLTRRAGQGIHALITNNPGLMATSI